MNHFPENVNAETNRAPFSNNLNTRIHLIKFIKNYKYTYKNYSQYDFEIYLTKTDLIITYIIIFNKIN